MIQVKRIAGIVLIVFLICLGFCGCCGEYNAARETVQLPVQTGEVLEEPATDPLLGRSLASEGNNYRLQKVIEKISSGAEVTVGFIGGSITEGYNAGTGENYVELVTDYLDKTYSDGSGRVTCVNAGLSGTPSMLGLIRAERDLLYAQPDLIFIEFAVNDAQSFTDKQAYEALIRKCLLQENAPAVILIYSVTENGYTCQNDMALTAFYYDLPAVSVRDAIMPEIESGTMKWTDWSDDDVHPHAEGHLLYSQFIANLIDTLVNQEMDAEYVIPKDCRLSRDWTNMTEYDSENLIVKAFGDFERSSAHPHFRNSYSYSGSETSGNEGITFEVTGTTLFLVYKAATSSTYGTAEVLVDGEVAAYLIASTPDGWNNPVTQLIYSEKEIATHEITIRMQQGDEGKKVDLLAIGIVHE